MGDWADMPSLSLYDKGKKSFEGRRYKEDIEAALDARSMFAKGINDVNRGYRAAHIKKYEGQKFALGGNHCEARISRVLEEDSQLIGTIGVDDLGYDRFGWTYVPYHEYLITEGFTFCHPRCNQRQIRFE